MKIPTNTSLPIPILALAVSISFRKFTNKEILAALSNGHPTERISQFVDYHLKPLVQTLPSYIKDTTHFLLKLQEPGTLPSNAILVTLDVSSLYTNIPHKEGIEACRHFLNTRSHKSLPMH